MPKPAILLSFAAIALFSIVALVGCSSPQALPIPPTAIPTLAPATMPAATAPGGGGPAAANQGQQIFETNCSGCHNLNNVTKVGPGLAILQTPNLNLPNGKPLSDANLADWIHTGGGAMPPFPQIQGDPLNSLIAYLKEATKTGGTAAPAATAAVTSTTGAVTTTIGAAAGGVVTTTTGGPGAATFSANCTVCHTLDNQVKVGPGLAILQTPNLQLPSGKPLSDANLADWIHNGGGGMPGFQQIQGQSMDDLISFLKEATKAAASSGGTPAGAPSTAQGKTTFDANCSSCHNLTAETKVGPGLAILQTPNLVLPNGKPLNDANLADWIHSPAGGMPPFPQIQGDQLNGLIAYLKEATKTPTTSVASGTTTALPPTAMATTVVTATTPATAATVPATETATATTAATATLAATATAVPPTETATTAATATLAATATTAATATAVPATETATTAPTATTAVPPTETATTAATAATAASGVTATP